MANSNPVVDAYSELARRYDDPKNLASCWGQAAANAVGGVALRADDKVVVDVGCGTGHALAALADNSADDVEFIGVEPAAGMRDRAEGVTKDHGNIRIVDGSFEQLPLADQSVDYLFSIFAFHWTTDVEKSVAELARVMKPTGAMDLYFIGRQNGREFIQATSPIFLKYLGARGLLASAGMRKQLTRDEAQKLYTSQFDADRLQVDESFHTFYDTLEGHWGWWVRIEGQFVQIPPERKKACDEDVKNALAKLQTDRGIGYTLHQLHVHLEGA